MTKPILKTVGGKSRLLDELIARAPKKFGRYYEPFVGGGALFFHLDPERAVLGDMNPDLIVFYLTLRDDVDGVIDGLKWHRQLHDKDHYYATRKLWNSNPGLWSSAIRAAMYLYLNKTCFNGLWRVNRKGEFNVPMGKYTRLSLPSDEALREASQALKNTTIVRTDFRETVKTAQRGDFVYFDPPYVPVSSTSNFTSYTVDGFTIKDQRDLAATARILAARGVHVLLSNSDTPEVRRLYESFTIEPVMCGRSINSKADKRGAVGEVIITTKTNHRVIENEAAVVP